MLRRRSGPSPGGSSGHAQVSGDGAAGQTAVETGGYDGAGRQKNPARLARWWSPAAGWTGTIL
ncbi:MAG: hypothetical protein QOD63_2245 [Actinomycetota bacterium]|jgi:hypothetical protein|nr:hypothetical protein [Actinomycetota bacterium]